MKIKQGRPTRSLKALPVMTILPIALIACGNSGDSTEPSVSTVTVSSTPSSESSTSTPTSTTKTTVARATEDSDDASSYREPTYAAEPTFVECYEANAALLSDGSVVTDTINCGVPAEQYEPYEPECTGGAAVCGYGYDEQGNPNPSSGELQAQWGCQQGYITDPAICAAVADL